MTIETLIDKQDTAEIVRDQIAAILAAESAAQVALATTAGKPDPNEWKLRVFIERANPWEEFPDKTTDDSPVINVWWGSASLQERASNTVERQKTTGTFNIDCYGYGRSRDNVSGGHSPGDIAAAANVQRAVRLVRNILMAAQYTYLGLRPTVWRRWIDSIETFQPQQDNQNVQHIVGARITFRVDFNEFSPQVVPEELCYLSVDVLRTEDNQVVIEADYDYENEDF